ncbi:MAG TPA: branched-chain amino acid ABC transporter permease [Solirubrobacteraceae bacterium]|nr:branched-chain amino acid ABC transporter permease [Solirubrobacteraceae bacterium]
MSATPPGIGGAGVSNVVARWNRLSAGFTTGFVALIAAMALVPVVLGANSVQELTTLLTFVLMAVMWNALAGYGGLVSVGLQAYIGLGAYATVWLADRGVNPYGAMVIATLFCGAVSIPLSFLVLRFRGAQFAIGTWVLAEAIGIYVSFDSSLGAGTGTSLTQLDAYAQGPRQHYTYWLTLAMTVFFVGLLFLLLRSRLGSSLQAIRDDEEAAASVGVRVVAGKRMLFVLAGLGCGAAGALTLANILFIEPTSIFSVNYSAFMIFMVLVGGLGTFEGPIIGAIIFYFIQNQFSSNGTWYLVALGGTAIAFALFLPRGLWGELEARTGLRFMPLGYRLEPRHTGAAEDGG